MAEGKMITTRDSFALGPVVDEEEEDRQLILVQIARAGRNAGNANYRDVSQSVTRSSTPTYDADPTIEAGIDELEPYGIDAYYHERREFGDPPPGSKCFACAYMGDMDVEIRDDLFNGLRAMYRDRIGRGDTAALAKAMAEYYEVKIRRPVNAAITDDSQTPLPKWPVAAVIDHLRHHTNDAHSRLAMLVERTRALGDEATRHAVLRSRVTKRKIIDHKAMGTVDRMTKLEVFLMSQNPKKFVGFYDGAEAIHASTHTQGAITHRTKRLRTHMVKGTDDP